MVTEFFDLTFETEEELRVLGIYFLAEKWNRINKFQQEVQSYYRQCYKSRQPIRIQNYEQLDCEREDLFKKHDKLQ